MIIRIFSSVFEDIGLNPKQRRSASRALVRTLCRLGTYRKEVDTHLRAALGKESERMVFKFWQAQRTNRTLIVCFWRAMHCYTHTQNAEYAELISGIKQHDIRYAFAQLTPQDIVEIKASNLDWRKPPITDKQIAKLMHDINGTIMHYSYKLRFIEACEGSLTGEDITGMLKLEALALINQYEGARSRIHIKNTVLRGLKSCWSETASYYKRTKRDSMPSHKTEDANGTHFEFESLRQGLTIPTRGDDGSGEMENPALLSKCVTLDKELEIKSIVRLVRKKVPRYGRYLGILVFDDRKHHKFFTWAVANNKSLSTHGALARSARRYCGVTPSDEAIARKIVASELGLPLPS